MSEQHLHVEEMVNTVSYGRKISDGNYGSREFTIFVQFHGDVVTDPEGWERNCRAAAAAAQMTTAQHLNIAVQMDSENFVREIMEQTFGAVTVVDDVPAAAPVRPAAAPAPAGMTNQYGDRLLGEHNGAQVWAKNGKFGPYVTNGTKQTGGKNANIKPPMSFDTVTLADAVRLLGI